MPVAKHEEWSPYSQVGLTACMRSDISYSPCSGGSRAVRFDSNRSDPLVSASDLSTVLRLQRPNNSYDFDETSDLDRTYMPDVATLLRALVVVAGVGEFDLTWLDHRVLAASRERVAKLRQHAGLAVDQADLGVPDAG